MIKRWIPIAIDMGCQNIYLGAISQRKGGGLTRKLLRQLNIPAMPTNWSRHS